MLRELTREEMQRMSGAGDGNNGGDRDRDYGSAIGTAAASAFVNIGSQCTKGSGNDRGVPFR
ncbi:hypothetical protein CMV60_15575 [Serratia marcescens]|nr:hypothetical protein CMV60_15575 [Serratia marcescens]